MAQIRYDEELMTLLFDHNIFFDIDIYHKISFDNVANWKSPLTMRKACRNQFKKIFEFFQK